MEAITAKELLLLDAFRERIADYELDWYLGHDKSLVRWLRARDHDLDKAEAMFRKHQEWRKINRVDELRVEDFPADLVEQIPFMASGKDNDGCFIIIVPFGKWDTRKLVEGGHGPLLSSLVDYTLELMVKMLRKESEAGNFICQGNIILDYNGFCIRQITSKQNIEFLLGLLNKVLENYPEILKLGVVVNAPKIFEILFNLCKPLITARTLGKCHIFGSNSAEWKCFLRKQLPHEALPSQYGGSNTTCFDYKMSDGENVRFNLCKPLPLNTTTEVVIEAGDIFKQDVVTNTKDCILRWSFYTLKCDIGFQVINEDGNVLIPLHLVDSQVNTMTGLFHAAEPGRYTLCFDNTHSRFKPKTLYYAVIIDEAIQENGSAVID